MPYYQASVWEISVSLDQLIPPFPIHKTSVWFLEKQRCMQQKDLGVCSLAGWIVDLFNLCLLLPLTADTKRQKRQRTGNAKLKAMATYSIGGGKS